MNTHPQTIQKSDEPELLDNLLSGAVEEKYHGKQVVVMGDQVQLLPEDDQQAVALVEALEEQYPDQTPHIVTVPRPETYVL